jgi:phosphopantothenoylcysteine decarboxylase/phosphopantothenate--cysteine ligase
MARLDGKRILLGVGGGIAAYKAPDLVRRLRDEGAEVRVVVTAAGARFVSPLSLEVVSGHPVGTDLWEPGEGSRIVHTDLAKESDLVLVAPATADFIGKVRHGLADDLLSTSVMASRTPVLLCPSMNTEMLENPIVRENLRALEALGRYLVLDPDSGLLACGIVGPGRLPDPPVVVEACVRALGPRDLAGVRVVVTAGPTREALDPVRFLSNPSTGTMGFALARALAARGADVSLVAGPVQLQTPPGVSRRLDVISADEMARAVEGLWDRTDVLVMTAAVADFRPREVAAEKVKKDRASLTIALEPTEDVLLAASRRPDRPSKLLVGFAAETTDVEANAREKLRRKDLDLLVANDVSREGAGFGTGSNEGFVLERDGRLTPIPRMDKARFAERVADLLAAAVTARGGFGGRDG